MIEETLKAIRALEILRIPQRLSKIERKAIWTVHGVRTINGLAPDDKGNITITSGGGSGDLTQAIANTLYVRLDGSNTPVTGDIIFPVTGYIMTDSSGGRWRVTVDTFGHLVTTLISAGGSGGSPIGLLLALTYP